MQQPPEQLEERKMNDRARKVVGDISFLSGSFTLIDVHAYPMVKCSHQLLLKKGRWTRKNSILGHFAPSHTPPQDGTCVPFVALIVALLAAIPIVTPNTIGEDP
jgi:hypothetical protein